MFLVLVAFVGILAAWLIHQFTWYLRVNHLAVTVVAGALSALGMRGFSCSS